MFPNRKKLDEAASFRSVAEFAKDFLLENQKASLTFRKASGSKLREFDSLKLDLGAHFHLVHGLALRCGKFHIERHRALVSHHAELGALVFAGRSKL